MKTKTKTKVKTIDIQAKEWLDRLNGNIYFAAQVTVNFGMLDAITFKLPFQYGYGSQYEQEAKDLLMKEGLIGFNDYGAYGKHPLSNHELREQGIIIRSNIQRGCLKRDVNAFGL